MGSSFAQARDVDAFLAPHSRKIRAVWKESLRHDHNCDEFAARLARLQTFPYQDVECEGIPAECLLAAVTHFVEASLPWLEGNPGRATTLFRWAARRQLEIVSACSVEVQREARQFSSRLADAHEKERRRLAHDLHDEIGHDLIVLKLYTETIALDLRNGKTAQVARKVKDSISLIKHALASVRSLTFDLGPAVWNEQGFVAAVRVYCRQFARRTGIAVRLNTRRLRKDLPQNYETAFYRVLQGAMSNVVAHAGAKRVTIALSSANGEFCLQISDDGRGFDVERRLRTRSHSFGLRAMKSRIELLGGRIEFQSARAGEREDPGTTIRVCVPATDFDPNEGSRDSSGL